MTNLKAYVLLAMASAIWGFQPSCVKWLVKVWTPVTIASVRYLILGCILLGWAFHKEGRKMFPTWESWPFLLCMGLCGIALNNVLQFTALKYTTVTVCTMISATTPCITAVASVLILKERLRPLVWLGIAISFLGVLTIVSKGSWAVLRAIDFNIGDILSFSSQVAWTGYTMAGMKAMKIMSPIAVTGWAGLLGAGMVYLYGITTHSFNPVPLSTLPMLSFLYILLLGGIFSMLAWNACSKVVGPSIATIFLNIMPMVGMLSGYVLFGDEIGTVQLFGAAAIIVGVSLVTNYHYVEAYLNKRIHRVKERRRIQS